MSKSHQIGLIIRSCRESRGISQDYMADMLDIVQSAYACLEAGKTTLSIDRLMRITEILDLDIHQVIEEGISSRNQMEGMQYRNASKVLSPDTKAAYDQLILELRSEVEFLKGIINRTF